MSDHVCEHLGRALTSGCDCPSICECWVYTHSFKRVSNSELDDYNKRYLLSDAEQDVIKKAIAWNKSTFDFSWSEIDLRRSIQNYEEIKERLR